MPSFRHFMPKKKKGWVILIIIILIVLIYHSSVYIFTYNNNAYVDSNTVAMSMSVAGKVNKVYVKDNQYVHKGEILLSLMPRPFKIAIATASEELNQAKAKQIILAVKLQKAQANIDLSTAQMQLAYLDWLRINKLYKDKTVSKETHDAKLEKYKASVARLRASEFFYSVIKKQQGLQKAVVAQYNSALNLAKYKYSLSKIYAPTNGYINNLKIYHGDYVGVGESLFGFVSNDSWRVVANIKESNLVNIHPGKVVWVYLFTQPWNLYKAKVVSLSRGVARGKSSLSGVALPYVKPVTDWIRYDYRFPVRIKLLNLPVSVHLRVGTDASIFILG